MIGLECVLHCDYIVINIALWNLEFCQPRLCSSNAWLSSENWCNRSVERWKVYTFVSTLAKSLRFSMECDGLLVRVGWRRVERSLPLGWGCVVGCAYCNQCWGLPEFLRQHGASGEFVKSMQSMCMVSIIEPVSSSKYLGSNLKDYCFSSSFQIVQVREHSWHTFVKIVRQLHLQITAHPRKALNLLWGLC